MKDVNDVIPVSFIVNCEQKLHLFLVSTVAFEQINVCWVEVFVARFWHFKMMCKKIITNFNSSWKCYEILWTNSDNSVFATGCNYFCLWANTWS